MRSSRTNQFNRSQLCYVVLTKTEVITLANHKCMTQSIHLANHNSRQIRVTGTRETWQASHDCFGLTSDWLRKWCMLFWTIMKCRQGKINYEICIVILIHRNEKEQSNNNNKKNTNNQNPHKGNQVSSLFLRVQIHVHSCEQKIYHYIAIIITFTLTYKNILKTF